MRNILRKILITAVVMLGISAFSGHLDAKAQMTLKLESSPAEGGYVGFDEQTINNNNNEQTKKGDKIGLTGILGYEAEFSIKAQAATYYEFVGWSESSNGSVFSNSTSYNYNFTGGKNDTHTIYAIFKKKSYSVSVSVSPASYGSISVNGGSFSSSDNRNWEWGTKIILEAKDLTGDFDGWYINNTKVSGNRSYEYTVPKDNTVIVAKYNKHHYSYTITPTEGTGILRVSGGGNLSWYTDDTLPKTELKAQCEEGYEFDGWYINNTRVSTSAEYTYTADASVSNNITIEARAKEKNYNVKAQMSPNDIQYGSVKVGSSGSGTTSQASAKYNSKITLVASTKNGYDFLGWYDGDTLLSTEKTFSYQVPAKDSTIIAKFEKHKVTVTVNMDPYDSEYGNIQAGSAEAGVTSQTRVEKKSYVTVKANPSSGYKFLGWYDGNTKISTEKSYTFMVGGNNVTLTAKFDKIEYAVTAQMDPQEKKYGSVKVGSATAGKTSSANVKYKTTVTLVATVNDGYDFIGWYDGETELSKNLSFEYTVPAKDSTITAKFKKHKYTVVVKTQAGDAGITATSGGKTVTWETGDSPAPFAEVSATVDSNYEFDHWEISGVSKSTDNTYKFYPDKNTPSEVTLIAKSRVKKVKFTATSTNENWGLVQAGSATMAKESVYTGEWTQAVKFVAAPKSEYDFVGWASDSEGKNIVSTDIEYTVTLTKAENVHLYAKFKPKTFTVTFVVEAGDLGIDSVSIDGTNTITWTYGDTVPAVKIKATVKYGNQFEGWYVNSAKISGDAETDYRTAANSSGTITLVAKSTPIQVPFSLVVDPAGGGSVAAQGGDWSSSVFSGYASVVKGQVPIDIAAMPSANYEFVGWFLADGTEVNLIKEAGYYYSDIYYKSDYVVDYTPGMSIVLKAKFRKITRDVTINTSASPTEGGTTQVISATGDNWSGAGSSKTVAIREGSVYSFKLKATASSGFSFVGWYRDGTFISSDAELTLNTDAIYDDTVINYVAMFATRPMAEITTIATDDRDGLVAITEINNLGKYANGGYYGTNITVSKLLNPPEDVEFKLVAESKNNSATVFRGWMLNTSEGGELILWDSVTDNERNPAYFKTVTINDVTENLTQVYYAIFKPRSDTYKIRLNVKAVPSSYGDVSVENSTYQDECNAELTANYNNKYSVTFRLKARTESGYVFAGWYDEAGNLLSTDSGYNYTVSKVLKSQNLKVEARFSPVGGATSTPAPSPTGGAASPTPTPMLTDTSLRILEIEPYASYLSDTEWKTMLDHMYGNNEYVIAGTDYSVRRMTTAEFIVNNDDLTSTYDLIYFGLKTNGYYTNTILPKIQADNSFQNSLIYSHTGPVWYVKSSRKGGLATGMADVFSGGNIKTRTSGNDITQLRYDEIIKFVKASGTVVFANGFLDAGNAINVTKIDSGTVLYRLVNTLKTNYTSSCIFYKNTQLNTTERTANKARYFAKYCRIKCISSPVTYSDSGSDATRYINGVTSTYRTLSFTFTIEDKATIQEPYKYYLGLFIDLNADGRFNSSDAETLSGLTIYDSTMGKAVDEGDYLYSWHTYIVSRDISEIVGVVPWMLKVARVEGVTLTEVCDSIEGYSAIKAREDEKQTLRVLQIYQGVGDDSQDFSKNGYEISYILPTTDDLINIARRKDATFDINTYKKADGSLELEKLYKYFSTHITKADFKNTDIILYDTNGNGFYFNSSNTELETRNGKNSRGEYTSVSVKGVTNRNSSNTTGVTAQFYELFMNLNEFLICTDRMSAAAYEKYVDGGKSLLDEYDMIILGFGDGYADFNEKACKDINRFISAGRTALFTHDTTSFNQSNGNYSGDWKWGYNINAFFRSKLAMDRYNVKNKNSTSSDTAVIGSTTITDSNQGFVDNFASGNDTTTLVDRINKGTVTEYPYTIPSRLTVGTTHTQYYQLDMENPNVVVWYSLASNSTSSVYNQNPKDGRNYYYIYNVGNVTYSGAGHLLGSASSILDELKLFVNTVVAAYRASGIPVDTIITNEDKTTGEKYDYLYVDFDSTDTTHALGDGISYQNGKEYKRVTFTVDDNSIISTTGIKVNYYILETNAAGEEIEVPYNVDTYKLNADGTLGTKVSASAVNDKGTKFYTVEADVDYGFDLDLTHLSQGSSMIIKIVTTISYGSEANGDLTEVPTNKYVEILRRGFFDLD